MELTTESTNSAPERSPEEHLEDMGATNLELPPKFNRFFERGNNPANNKMSQSKNADFNRVSLQKIMEMEFEPIKWAIEGYVPEGLSVIAGRQKLGKTWLALDLSIAVATGGHALGSIPCKIGNVLYLDLENGHRRLQRRIEIIFPKQQTRPYLGNIEIVTESPQLDKGLIEALEKWRHSVAEPRLVIIDVLQRIKPAGKTNRNAYENDYAIFQNLQSWATENGIAVLGLHHTRKGGADDPLEALSGSNGLSAVADTTLVLDRNQNGTTLYVRGRDVEEKETALRHDLGIWELLGEAAEVHRTDERKVILQCLADNLPDNQSKSFSTSGQADNSDNLDASMTPTEIAGALGLRVNNVKQLLHKMAKAGEVQKIGRGRYIHPDGLKSAPSPISPDNLDNHDNFEGM